MSSHLNFRVGSSSEKQSLQQLGILSYNQFSRILAPEDWAIMHRFLHSDKIWDQLVNNAKIFVCEDEGKLAGMAYLVSSGNPTHYNEMLLMQIRCVPL